MLLPTALEVFVIIYSTTYQEQTDLALQILH